ncbi:MAG: hypothetical protein WD847_10035 [Pirellulales bacterium]
MMLVLLRITIGWHFLYAGLWKLEHPEFSSEGFLSQAKGPLADKFVKLVPDEDGRERLDPARWGQHTERLDRYFEKFKEHYRPSDEQIASATAVLEAHKTQTSSYLDENREEIEEYLYELQRLDRARQAAGKGGEQKVKAEREAGQAGTTAVSPGMPYVQERLWSKKAELKAQARTWLAELDRIYGLFKRDLDALLVGAQRETSPPVEPVRQIEKMDMLVTYSNIAIGACLIAGLFTRLAALGGGLFLLSIVLAQPDWPGLYPPPPPSTGRSLIVTKEFVEMMALFALATTRVGRWGGLDYFIHHLLVRPIFSRKQ